MDESWRMRMGTPSMVRPSLPRRRSTEDSSRRRRAVSDDISGNALDPEDFADVFGGPPRTVLSRQFSGDHKNLRSSSTTSLFHAEKVVPAIGRSGRNLPEFKIPASRGGMSDQKHKHSNHNVFYNDVFGFGDERVIRSRSRSKSKTSSASVLSSEELSPQRPAIEVDGHDDVSVFASKLRPVNVRSRRQTQASTEHTDYESQEIWQAFASNRSLKHMENNQIEPFRSPPSRLVPGNSSPQAVTLDRMSAYGSMRMSPDDLQLNSPASVVTSVCQLEEQNSAVGIESEIFAEKEPVLGEDEVMSSYVIEINSDPREDVCEAIGVEEAIAWAKEKFQTYCSEVKSSTEGLGKEKFEEMINKDEISEGPIDYSRSIQRQQEAEQGKWDAEERDIRKNKLEMQILDEKIRLWSTGKKSDVRLLLSTLHHILWPNSGWVSIPLVNLVESSQVRKAYKKARLCLHPDKLQQRGATLPHKYIADKAFAVLQDAWAVFVSQNVFQD